MNIRGLDGSQGTEQDVGQIPAYQQQMITLNSAHSAEENGSNPAVTTQARKPGKCS